MSKFKKLISLVLALAMCLSLFGTISFADDGETEESDPVENTAASGDYETIDITIENVVAGHTYYVYELLTGDFSEDEDGNVVLSNAEPGYSVARDEDNNPYFTADEINAMLLSYTTETTTDEEGNETTEEVVETNEDGDEIYLTEGELSTKAYELVTNDGIENDAGTYEGEVLTTAVRSISISYSDADDEGNRDTLVNGETSEKSDYYDITTDSEGDISITFTLAEGYYVIYEAETEESSDESDASESEDTESEDTESEDAEDAESSDDTTTSTTTDSEDYQNVVDLVEEQEGTTISRCIVAIVWSKMDSTTIALKTTTPTIDKNIVNENDANEAISETTDEETGNTVTGDSDNKVDTAAIGDTIEYELTGYLPDTTGYAYYYYVLTDTMSQGLTLDLDSFVVDVDYANAVTSGKYEVTESHTALLDGAVFIVDIDDLDEDGETDDWVNARTEIGIEEYCGEIKNEDDEVTGYSYSYTNSSGVETTYEYFVYVTYEYEYETTTITNEDGTTTTTKSIKLDDDGNRVVSSTTFTLTLLNLVDQDFAKSTETDIITVYYEAELNSNAEVGLDANTNNVTLTYSNNPNSSEEYIPGDDDTTPPGMPGEDTPTGTTPKIWTYTYTTQVSVLKLDGDGEYETDDDGNVTYTEALAGAEFTLTGTNLNSVVVTTGTSYEAATDENSDDDSTYYYLLQDGTYSENDPSSETENEDGTKSYEYDYTDYEYVEDEPEGKKYVEIEIDGVTYYFVKYVAVTVLEATETENENGGTEGSVVGWVDSDGWVTFTGLNVGDYVLSETVTPDGYNTVDDIEFNIGVETSVDSETGKYIFNWTVTYDEKTLGEDAITYNKDTGTFSMSVVNFPGFTLPSTGAIGQIVLYAIGLLLIFGAGTVLIVRKKKTKKNMLS